MKLKLYWELNEEMVTRYLDRESEYLSGKEYTSFENNYEKHYYYWLEDATQDEIEEEFGLDREIDVPEEITAMSEEYDIDDLLYDYFEQEYHFQPFNYKVIEK